MRRLLLSSSIALATFGIAPLTRAQDPAPGSAAEPSGDTPDDQPATSEPDAVGDTPYDQPEGTAGEQPRVLEPPSLPPLEVERGAGAPALPDPAASADRLAELPPVEKRGYTIPQTVFQLHGYLRLRGTFLKDGALGHVPYKDRISEGGRTNYDPFPFFTPDDSTRRTDTEGSAPVAGGCGDSASSSDGSCGKRGQVSGDMRFRLKPEIHLSDDVRVKAWIDVFDNVGLGTLGYGPDMRPNTVSGDSAIRVRRVWGEARNRDIGELRFGRMGADWGLGILDNGGDRYGIDSDFSSDVDRLMGITNLAGFYLMAAYDWASEGKVLGKTQTPSGVPLDVAQKDDRDAFTFAAARKLDDAAQQSAIARGESVFNYGVYFVYRNEQLRRDPAVGDEAGRRYVRIDQQQFIPDLWFQMLWEGLRVELEASFVAGSREGGCPRLIVSGAGSSQPERTADEAIGSDRVTTGSCKFRQLGVALETEYRLFDERLGLHLMGGVATGDSNAYGLAATNDPALQRAEGDAVGDRTISTYEFHPDYRVDLILWRTVMRRVAGAYYVKPGVSYDFIRDPYGQLAGGRLDVVYSRAAAPSQTWGKDGNLGLELDLSLYYRSEDGPDPMDGFYGLVQWGVLFPFQGLGYADTVVDAPGKKNAMVLRGVVGIAF